MLFQTYYRLDPCTFEPPLYDSSDVSLVSAAERFRFHLFHHFVGEFPDDEKQILAFALMELDVEPSIASIFEGTRGFPPSQAPESIKDGLEDYPEAYASFVRATHSRMDALTTQAFDLLMWRYRIRGGPLQLHSSLGFLRWKNANWTDPIDPLDPAWKQIPFGVQTLSIRPITALTPSDPELASFGRLAPSESDLRELSDRLESSGLAPLGQNLLREAWRHAETDHRSALVMAIAAAEAGVKECIAELAPDTRWLLENTPSPPLIKMLRDFLPQLQARSESRGSTVTVPKETLRALQEAVEQRNRVIHGAPAMVAPGQCGSWLIAIQDLLYLLDHARGVHWALDHLSPECRARVSPSH